MSRNFFRDVLVTYYTPSIMSGGAVILHSYRNHLNVM